MAQRRPPTADQPYEDPTLGNDPTLGGPKQPGMNYTSGADQPNEAPPPPVPGGQSAGPVGNPITGGSIGQQPGAKPLGGGQAPSAGNGQGYNYDQSRDSWMSGKYARTPEGVRQWMAENPTQGVQYGGGDTIYLPHGGEMDIIGNYGGGAGNGRAMTSNWTPMGGPGGSGGGYGGGGGGLGGSPGGGGPGGSFNGDLKNALQSMFPNGTWNQDRVNRRTENASESLNRFGKQRQSSNRAELASRGLIGSGPEQGAQNLNEERIADQYSQAVSGIYGDESARADQSMISALQTAAGMSEAEARNAIDSFRAQNEFTLGQGNLALGNMRASNDYNLGAGQLGLQRDQLGYNVNQGDYANYLKWLELNNQRY